jgi:hypothetical protein
MPELSATQTPVDLQHYTVRRAAAEPPPAAEVPAAQSTEEVAGISRRPRLDFMETLPAPAARQPSGVAGDMALDSAPAFDLPAFLRREG